MGVLKSLFSDYKKLSLGAGRYAGEFDAWQPIRSYATKEDAGSLDSSFVPALPAIPAKVPLPAYAPMQNYFEEIAKRVWKAAKPSMVQKLMFERKDFLAQTRVAYPPPSAPPPQPFGPAGPQWWVPTGERPPLASPTGMPGTKGAQEIPDVPQLDYLKGVAKDWQLTKDLVRINAYTFRGDSREPHVVMKNGGFNPPSSRTDTAYLKNTVYPLFIGYMVRRFGAPKDRLVDEHTFMNVVNHVITSPEQRRWWIEYTIWRALEEQEKFHTGRMVAEEALKGYISTTRDIRVAKGFALRAGQATGWVYVVLIEGGIVVPDKGKHAWSQLFGEQEIAYPASVPWAKIYGFRQVEQTTMKFGPNQPLLLRKGFQEKDPEAFKQCYALLSGKPQSLAAAA